MRHCIETPDEITDPAKSAVGKLVDSGIPVGNQTVLLRGINDDARTIECLMRRLLMIRVKSYYLHQADLTLGTEHFRTPLQTGIRIMETLRGRVSGMAIPTFVVDLPGGGGKVPVLPEYVLKCDEGEAILRNFEGKTFRYPQPQAVQQAAA